MSYFQKYQKHSSNSHRTSLTFQNSEQDQHHDSRTTASQSKQSYLKAFKKYYIDQLLQKKLQNSDLNSRQCQKQNRSVQENRTQAKRRSQSQIQDADKMKLSILTDLSKAGQQTGVTHSKITTIVNNNDSQISEALYNSISEVEKEIMSIGQGNDLARENRHLRQAIKNLKRVLKDKLESALKKNKEELTLMFQEYSGMIKKLLEDKEVLTGQVELHRQRAQREQRRLQEQEEEYENRINTIVEDNRKQVGNTQEQIEQFLEIIVQYQQQAAKQKVEFDAMRQRIVQLQMENDQLRGQNTSFGVDNSVNKPQAQLLEKYTQKIEHLLVMIEALQSENLELNEFLKMCKCSRIASKSSQESIKSELSMEQVVKSYQRKLIDSQKTYIKEEMHLRQALRRKDECIDRLNLVIEEFRKMRYSSVDRLTAEAVCNK